MPTAGSLITNIQLFHGDTGGDFITDVRGLEFLNQSQKRFCHEVLALDEIKDYTIASKVIRHDLPTDCIMPMSLMWYQTSTRRLEYQPPNLWYDTEEDNPNSTGNPDYWTIIRRQILVGPQVPQTNSATSTASGSIGTTATTLNLTAASGTFRSKGFAKIENEVVEFSGVATTTLTGVIRGVHGTTAATHASATKVTQIDMQCTYRKEPVQMTATADVPEIPEAFHSYLEKYAGYLSWLARGDMRKAEAAYNEFEKLEKEAQKTISRRSMDGILKIQERFNRRRWAWW